MSGSHLDPASAPDHFTVLERLGGGHQFAANFASRARAAVFGVEVPLFVAMLAVGSEPRKSDSGDYFVTAPRFSGTLFETT